MGVSSIVWQAARTARRAGGRTIAAKYSALGGLTKLGEAYLRANPKERDVAVLSEALEGDLRAKVREDFAADRLVLAGGCWLSVTEARRKSA